MKCMHCCRKILNTILISTVNFYFQEGRKMVSIITKIIYNYGLARHTVTPPRLTKIQDSVGCSPTH